MVLARVHKLVLLVRGTKNAELGMLRAKVPYTHIHTQQTHTHTQEPTRESNPDDVLRLGGGGQAETLVRYLHDPLAQALQ